ncbi:hypothetical protein EHQ12_17700 [Leptospira gomenensis]|uniref:Uncharacterized protein n=1 Tax=Leptospira gomenensis TaxID=2484974 RepID=A0A5F1YCS0_9LEPT|nr:hypothetical protein EHQ12_17700 [Leptospira gomenensis]TGK35588.1 hypothetical protein EHQ17_06625 [Leptospira gomenensis]TGK40912.1 hypothetical protein EHQ07_17585 [Leptospira gomenensis]TGK61202.1 hypothetical protein EHQ13_10120 [Leptospira gomenensis]
MSFPFRSVSVSSVIFNISSAFLLQIFGRFGNKSSLSENSCPEWLVNSSQDSGGEGEYGIDSKKRE